MAQVLNELDDLTSVAREALDMMDEGVFERAQGSFGSKEQVGRLLKNTPGAFKNMLKAGSVRTMDASYMAGKTRSALASGVLTPWESDDVVVIPWDEEKKKIIVQGGDSLPAVLAHEYTHFIVGPHSFSYLVDVHEDTERTSAEWTALAREHGDVPYLVGDLLWLLDEWSENRRDNEGDLTYLDMAEVFGIDHEEAEVLAERIQELSRERDQERLAEVRRSEGASRLSRK